MSVQAPKSRKGESGGARKPGARLGKFHLVERLGRGGMAEVWRAHSMGPKGFRRTAVVKRILPHLAEDPQFVEMFLAEARLSARLEHPNIVAVHELGEDHGDYFIAMEYVRGRDLVTVLRAHDPSRPGGMPAPGMAAFVMREVARALAYAHSLTDEDGHPLRIIHRDVSPSNVMISFDGAVKLLDFGLAKALAESGDEHTKTGVLRGKFGYMSPEQIQGLPVDHRVDVFAAGVVLWETLTARRLFKGQSDMQSIALVREAKVELPSTVNPDVPKSLDAICMKALAKDREERYQSCDEMAQALDGVARELGWGQERVAAMMRDLFRGDSPGTWESQWSISIDTVQDEEGAKRRLRSWLMVGALALVVTVFASLAVVHAVRRRTVHAMPAAPIAAPKKPAPMVTIEVSSTPAGALVFLDGDTEARGTTPLQLSLLQGGPERRLRLQLGGHKELLSTLTTESNARLVLALTALPPAPPAPLPATPRPRPLLKPKPAQPTVPQTLKGGGVVDPFAPR